MSHQHTLEPWAQPYYEHADGDRGWWIHNDGVGADEYAILVTFALNPNAEADARRIVACVNACTGIPNGNLEADGVFDVVMKERDALLLALKEAELEFERMPNDKCPADTIQRIREAIAKTEAA